MDNALSSQSHNSFNPNDFLGLVLAGEYPGSQNKTEAERKLADLLDSGIRRMISLMEADECDHDGNSFKGYGPTIYLIAEEKSTSIAC